MGHKNLGGCTAKSLGWLLSALEEAKAFYADEKVSAKLDEAFLFVEGAQRGIAALDADERARHLVASNERRYYNLRRP